MSEVTENLLKIHQRIETACVRCGRNSSEVNLIAVSKLQDLEKIRQALLASQTNFGENYVQEWQEKAGKFLSEKIQWHLIGHLQKNKCKLITGKMFRIHSVDSLELLEILNRKAGEKNISEKILLQINVAGESSKEGFSGDSFEKVFSNNYSNIQIMGLMTMPPLANTPEQNRSHFQALRKIRDGLQKKYSVQLPELSMGTSSDFEIAVEEGANWIRVGSEIFGRRN